MSEKSAETNLYLGGKSEISGETLGRAWLGGQDRSARAIADGLAKLDEDTLLKVLDAAYKPTQGAQLENETPEVKVMRAATERFINLIALHLSGGETDIAGEWLGANKQDSQVPGASLDSLALELKRRGEL